MMQLYFYVAGFMSLSLLKPVSC